MKMKRKAGATTTESNVFSMSVNSSWKPAKQDATVLSRKSTATTYQMQINGDIITMTPQNACVNARPNGKNPVSVARRNARERRRIKNVNSAFDELRQHVPAHEDRNRKKISKVDTLQSAIEYIKALEELVRNRRGATSSHVSEQPENKENIIDRGSLNNSPLSFNYSESDNEENTSTSQSNNQSDIMSNSNEKLDTHQSKITDTMRKAFDIMLHKNISKLSSAVSSPAPEHVTNTGSTFTEKHLNVSEQNFSNSNITESMTNPVLNTGLVNDMQPDISPPETHCCEIPSPILRSQTQASICNNFAIQSGDFQYSGDLQNEVKDNVVDFLHKHNTSDNSNETNKNSFISTNTQRQFCPFFPAEHETDQWLRTYSAPLIYSEQNPNISNSPESTNFTENDDDAFGSPENFVPMNLDQINPSIDFLPPDSDDASYYTNSFSTKSLNSALEQANPNFINHSTETCWVLAQLN